MTERKRRPKTALTDPKNFAVVWDGDEVAARLDPAKRRTVKATPKKRKAS